jgi:hypothetical protein
MTPSELKHHISQAGHEPHFFDRKTMSFFGDRIANFGCREGMVLCDYDEDGNYVKAGVTIEVWELYRKHAVKHGLKSSHFFSKASFKCVHPRKPTT